MYKTYDDMISSDEWKAKLDDLNNTLRRSLEAAGEPAV